MEKYIVMSAAFQTAVVIAFLSFILQADYSMNKDGIGDIENWRRYNSVAGWAISIGIGMWLTNVLLALRGKVFSQSVVQNSVAVPPLICIFGWVVLWFV